MTAPETVWQAVAVFASAMIGTWCGMVLFGADDIWQVIKKLNADQTELARGQVKTAKMMCQLLDRIEELEKRDG